MLITATDVSMIARVRRPVVSMWRKRYAGADAFPEPDSAGLFDAERVVGWLTEHGRGNNPQPERALPLLGMLVEARTDVARAMDLSAVLAFRAAYGEELVDDLAAHRGAALGGLDAWDRLHCFGSEVLALGDGLPETAAAVDAFLDERFGAADAMRWLADDCLVRHLPPFAAAGLSDAAAGLVARAAVGLADLSPQPSLLDSAGTGFSWLQHLPPEWPAPVGIRVDESPVGRHSRRVLQVGEWDALAVHDERGWAVAVDAALDADPSELFARAALGDDRQVRLVLGPARLLADPAGDLVARDALLRDGVVRAVVKLPAGCRPAHPREALALWLVAERDELPFEQHRTFVADLTGVDLPQVTADLVVDLTVAAQDLPAQQHRAWRVLRPALTRHLLARRGSLVAISQAPTGRRAQAPTPAELEAKAEAVGLGTLPLPRSSGARRTRSEITAQTGLDDGWLKLLAGSRISPDQLGEGDLTVWTADGGRLARTVRVDRLAALGRPRTWLTQPGDVILGPGPAAVLDLDGGSLVAAPARALRLTTDAPVTAQQLARAVAAASRGTRPSQWRLTPLDPAQRAALSAAADRIGQRRAELAAQLDALNSFEDALLDACETTTLTLETR
ncbi:hypothetical protein H5399_13290 [Tessaracoccus sp. MC1627]|uniref:hypothetical protein n=1 Tax=Tessaracoccus sp. MC1627 TaxID=2760312 RepID=UPI0016020A66|nr:hypothetical protein [Tessaracoccus sp. MC1627]MBB1513571.1 hypothetical protein [Tessaracoccus sp. MC1627]